MCFYVAETASFAADCRRATTNRRSVSHRVSSFFKLSTRTSLTGCVELIIRRASCSEGRFVGSSILSDLEHSDMVPDRISQNFTASRASNPAWARSLCNIWGNGMKNHTWDIPCRHNISFDFLFHARTILSHFDQLSRAHFAQLGNGIVYEWPK